jgi:hypothetical protein
MAVLVMVVSLTLVGCSDDDEDVADATPADLENLVFTFTDGAAFDPGLAGDAVTLTFGDFVGNVGTFTLTSGGNTASGVVVIATCEYDTTDSNFPAGAGPQEGDQFTHDPCEINQTTGAYSGTNTATGQTSTSGPPSGTGGGGS